MSAAAAEVEAAVERKAEGAVEPEFEAPARTQGEERVVLHGVSWETFERLLEELGDNRNCRLAYNEGELEIMSPKRKHEQFNWFLGHAVYIASRELGLNLLSLGALTCRREDLLRGIEPDCCFYIQNEPRVREFKEIDLKNDPPPDLMIEVDISNSSMDKLPILAALGVPEFWRCSGDKLEIYGLSTGKYVELEQSPAFGGLALKTAIPAFFAMSQREGAMAALAAFEKWIREQISKR